MIDRLRRVGGAEVKTGGIPVLLQHLAVGNAVFD